MIKPIIIAILIASAPAFAAEGPLLTKITKIMGCEGWLRAELMPERAAVLTQVKNLASRITLLSQMVNSKQFNSMVGSTPEELDASLAQLANDLLDSKPNALRTEDIKASLENLESRLMDNLTTAQRQAVTVADAPVPQEAKAEVQTTAPQYMPNEFQRPTMGWRLLGPGGAKP